jgi:hypothetical protein
MMPYTQNELSAIWKELTDGTERDAHDEIDVSALVSSRNLALLMARIVTSLDVEQALTLSASVGAVEPYRDEDKDRGNTIGSYVRRRGDKEATWGLWERAN